MQRNRKNSGNTKTEAYTEKDDSNMEDNYDTAISDDEDENKTDGKIKAQNGSKFQTNRMENFPRISSHDQADKIFRALGLGKVHDDNLRILDTEDSLVLIHYLVPNQKVSHARGIVIDTEGPGSVVCQSFPFTKEYIPSDQRLKYFDFKDATLSLAYEGTVLRVYFAAGKWRISTHRKIDASKSRWSGEPFEETFKMLWGDTVQYDDAMSRLYCYAFLLSDPNNRIVCDILEYKLYHVGTFAADKKGLSHSPLTNQMYFCGKHNPKFAVKNKNISLPESLTMTKEEVCNFLVENDETFVKKATGILVTTSQGKTIKIIPPCYQDLRNLRGNEPSFRKRLMYLWREDTKRRYDPDTFGGPSEEISTRFMNLFPEKEFLSEIQQFLQTEIPWLLGNDFEYRYVQSQYLELEPPVYHLLQNVKRFFNPDRTIEDNIRYQMSRIPLRQMFQVYECLRERKTEETYTEND